MLSKSSIISPHFNFDKQIINSLINIDIIYVNNDTFFELVQYLIYVNGLIITEDNQTVNLLILVILSNELTKLPIEIGKLYFLEQLLFHESNIIELPKEIGNLYNLKSLNIYSSKLTQIPVEICNLHSLEYLEINKCNISELPKQIGQLTNLIFLTFENNNLTEIPSEIIHLKKLKRIYLNNNKLTTLPEEIGKMPSLSYLHIPNNNICELPISIWDSKIDMIYFEGNPLNIPVNIIGGLFLNKKKRKQVKKFLNL